MFLFYVLRFFKIGETIQGGTLLKGGHYLRKYSIFFTFNLLISIQYFEEVAGILTLFIPLEFFMRAPTQFSTFKQSHLSLPWGLDLKTNKTMPEWIVQL